MYFADLRSQLDGRGNFGDELNNVIWPDVLGAALELATDKTLVGIGTILSNRLARFPDVIVCGAGTGYEACDRSRLNGTVYCVRGPLTADALGLPRMAAAVDPGILAGEYAPALDPTDIGYMPHAFEVIQSGHLLLKICEDLGLRYVDPCQPVGDVLKELAKCKLLITEAMHGAIVADSMRIPWCPVATSAGILEFKWLDWCASLELEFSFKRVYRFARLRRFGRWYETIERQLFVSQLKKVLRSQSSLLSDEKSIDRARSKLMAVIEQLKDDLTAGQIGRNGITL